MTHEGEPQPAPQPASIITSLGEISEEVFQSYFGLGIAEAQQTVTWGEYQGTVAEMLVDERCPVGKRVHNAFVEKGIDGVVKQFAGLNMMDENFTVEISKETLERGRAEFVKKKFQKTPLNPPSQ